MYRLASGGVRRLADEAFIPADVRNRDWRKYQEWLGAGGVPNPEFTQAELDAQAARDAAAAQKLQDIANNLPSWTEIEAAIEAVTSIAGLKVMVKRLARVVYWLARDRAD